MNRHISCENCGFDLFSASDRCTDCGFPIELSLRPGRIAHASINRLRCLVILLSLSTLVTVAWSVQSELALRGIASGDTRVWFLVWKTINLLVSLTAMLATAPRHKVMWAATSFAAGALLVYSVLDLLGIPLFDRWPRPTIVDAILLVLSLVMRMTYPLLIYVMGQRSMAIFIAVMLVGSLWLNLQLNATPALRWQVTILRLLSPTIPIVVAYTTIIVTRLLAQRRQLDRGAVVQQQSVIR